MKITKKKRQKNYLYLALLVLFVLLLVISAAKITDTFVQYKKDEKLYNSVNSEYTTVSEKKINEASEAPWQELININIEELKKINPEIIGWIYFENENISYPVLYSGDNEKYLQANFKGEKSSSGFIFMDEKNENFNDSHVILHGHNMKNGTMFGKLSKYKTNKSYYEGHEYFQLITKKNKYRYKIISCKNVPDTSDIYRIYKNGSKEFAKFVKEQILKGSYLNTNLNVTSESSIVSLSTCSSNDSTRFIVSAVRVEEFTRS